MLHRLPVIRQEDDRWVLPVWAVPQSAGTVRQLKLQRDFISMIFNTNTNIFTVRFGKQNILDLRQWVCQSIIWPTENKWTVKNCIIKQKCFFSSGFHLYHLSRLRFSVSCLNKLSLSWWKTTIFLNVPTHRTDSKQPTAFIRPLCCLFVWPLRQKSCIEHTDSMCCLLHSSVYVLHLREMQ